MDPSTTKSVIDVGTPLIRPRMTAPYRPTSKTGPAIIVMPDTGEGLDQITPPLGTLAVAGLLEQEGIGFVHLDQRVEPNAEELVLSLVRDGALCLGMGYQTGPQISYAVRLSQAVKAEFPDFPIIWAGWHPSILPQQTLEHPAVDIIVRGQGELTMLEVIERLKNDQGMEGVMGVAYKQDDQIRINPDRGLADLNIFPDMAYHLIDFKDYPGPSNRRSSPEDRFANFRSSQGCPWRCAYCADPLVFDRKWKALTAERTVDELEKLVDLYGITYVDFVDDTFIVDHKRIEHFAREMIRRKIPLKWSANARTGMIVRLDQSVLDLFAEAGCDIIHPGVEASSQEMLDYIHKDEKNENTLKAAEKLARAGIVGLYGFMVAFPEEPADTAKRTFHMIKELKEIDANNIMPVNFYVPYPGNVLYDRSLEKSFTPPTHLEEWSDFGTRAGLAAPWITDDFRNEVMKVDKFYLPAAYPSRLMKYRIRHSRLGWLYNLLHKIARYRVKREWYSWDLDWRLVYMYWKFWEKWHRRFSLHNLNFR